MTMTIYLISLGYA